MCRYCDNNNKWRLFLFTFSGRLRCETLPPASRLSRFCRVPSSRSRPRTRPARGSAGSTAKFSCEARTRSPVGAAPFPWHQKVRPEKKSFNEPDFPRLENTPGGESSSGWGGCGGQTAPGRLQETRILFTKESNTRCCAEMMPDTRLLVKITKNINKNPQ